MRHCHRPWFLKWWWRGCCIHLLTYEFENFKKKKKQPQTEKIAYQNGIKKERKSPFSVQEIESY